MTDMTEDQIRLLAREVAREVVHGLLDDAGISMEDLIYLRKQRQGSEDVAKWIKRSAIGVFVTAALWGAGEALKALWAAKVGG